MGGDTESIKTFDPADLKLAKPLKLVKEEALEDIKAMKDRIFRDLYMTRHNYEITISDGLLYNNCKPLSTREGGRFKFIQDRDGTIFGIETKDDSEGVKHSSLMGEDWPISAGTISATNGRIDNISNASGHFRPTRQHLELTVSFLKSKGVSVERQSPYFGEDKSKRLNTLSAKDFRRRYGTLPSVAHKEKQTFMNAADPFIVFYNRKSIF